MAITFRAVATATTGATPANTLTIAKPTGVANGDALVCVMAVESAANFGYTIPPGWGLVDSQLSPTTQFTLLVFVRTGKVADPAAGWTWVFDSARNAVGSISAYYDSTASTFCRICNLTEAASASNSQHDSPGITSNVSGQTHLIVYAAAQQDTWTHDGAYTERDDNTTSSGTADICITIGDKALAGTGAVSGVTAFLDSAASAEAATMSLLVTSMGMAQGTGSLTSITVHDNTKMESAQYYDLAEIVTSYPTDLRVVGVAGGRTCYEFVPGASAIPFSIGAVSSPQATTWYERGNSLNANNRSLATNASNLSSWSIDWERVFLCLGAGSTTFFRGNLKLVDCRIDTSGALTIANGAGSLTGELTRCLVTHNAGAGTITLGSATFHLATVRGLTVESETNSSTDILSGIFADVAEDIRIKGTGTFRSFLGANAVGAFDIKGLIMEGSPTAACIRWGGANAKGFKVRNVNWPEGEDKVVVVTSGSPALGDALLDGATLDFRYVDKVTRAPLTGKRLKITDLIGNVVVNAVSDADGWVKFGADMDEQNVWLADWYAVGLVETLRLRTPLKLEMNPVGDPSYDPAYESITYDKWGWPTNTDYTLSTGSFLPQTWEQPLGPPPVPSGIQQPPFTDDIVVPADLMETTYVDLHQRS